MTDLRVSAIIIVYNGATFLREAIDSVVTQTLTDWELLIVDDGSTDESAVIAQEFVATRPGQVRLLRHADGKNHGMSAARNLGIAQARGDYVGFLDADDVWLPEKLLEQVAIFESNASLGMVYGRTTIWYSWGCSKCVGYEDFYYDLGVTPNRAYKPPHVFENLLRNVYQTPTTCNALMRRSVVIDVGAFEEAFKGMFEDQVFFANVLVNGPVYVSSRVWAKYRQHPESASAASNAAGADEAARLRFLRWVAQYLAKRNDIGSRTRLMFWSILAKAWWDFAKTRIGRRFRQAAAA
jgi:glycosyltransferase involved in cell wall biosynthesis